MSNMIVIQKIMGEYLMSLNESDNIINQISQMTCEQLEEVDLEVYLVSKAKLTDNLYTSVEEHLDPKLRQWVKESIRKELGRLKFEDEDGRKKFFVSDYDFELTKNDFIAKLDLTKDETLIKKKNKLLQSLSIGANVEDSEVKFQVIKLTVEDECAYFIYYRGIKQSAMTKRNVSKMPTIRHGDHLVIQENDVVEFGGKIELIIYNEEFYIISPRTLEYSFDYNDHISIRKDENLHSITSMDFFDEDPNVDVFVEKSNQYMVSRRLAGIEPGTLRILERSFVERCKELKEIKEKTPLSPSDKKAYIDRYELLWPLFDHIDVFDKKIKIDPDKSIEPLIYFFADKIVESFLTKEFREAL
ncbi:hypothetical protein CSV61_12295 [Sporosarcina sp. P3]|nr:hypothetical protein CSV61_12295 [Sporosarcina sp. P3]